jgi:hypothetical protein
LFGFGRIKQFGDPSELVSKVPELVHAISQQQNHAFKFVEPVEDIVEFLVDQFIVIQFDDAVHAGHPGSKRKIFELLCFDRGIPWAGVVCASGRLCVL